VRSIVRVLEVSPNSIYKLKKILDGTTNWLSVIYNKCPVQNNIFD
jgi:hypothetical protein